MKGNSFFKNLGPGPIIAAAFIGPGTVTVCTLAGANFGFSLLWALGLSIIATIVLQEITGRIGLVTGRDLSGLLRDQPSRPLFKTASIALVFLAIGLGNAAYESGNIAGANLGLQVFWESPVLSVGEFTFISGNFLLGMLSFCILWAGNYKRLEFLLVCLVIFMSISFLIVAALTDPPWVEIFTGFIPSWDEAEIPTLVALIGTTVVPYNLFLYASLSMKKWDSPSDLSWMRTDISLAVILGGVVSMAVLMVGAANTSEEINNAIDVSRGLEPVFGSAAKYLMGFGLLAAGLTSSITAPLAAGLVICGIMGWSQEIQSTPMRICMATIVGLGLVFASFGIKPIQLITLAQLANGILLPLVSGWIIWLASRSPLMGRYRNSPLQSFFAILIWLITFILGVKSIFSVLNG